MSANAILKRYFGTQPGQGLSGFIKEVAKLTPAGKKELATGAAKELGVELDKE